MYFELNRLKCNRAKRLYKKLTENNALDECDCNPAFLVVEVTTLKLVVNWLATAPLTNVIGLTIIVDYFQCFIDASKYVNPSFENK